MRLISTVKAGFCLALFAAITALGLPAAITAQAATPNLAAGTPGVVLLPVHLQGQFTTTTADVATIKLPFQATVLGVSVSARASGGTTPTLTVDVEDDDTTILSTPVAVTAGAVAEATVSAPQIADESVLTIDLTIGGGSPTWDDIDVLIVLFRN